MRILVVLHRPDHEFEMPARAAREFRPQSDLERTQFVEGMPCLLQEIPPLLLLVLLHDVEQGHSEQFVRRSREACSR
jgi:hypothetical protein